MTADTIARLKITLDDVKPIVLRRVEVPATLRLDRLHLAIQAAMGWTNTHLYEILARDSGWGIPDPDGGDGPLDARKARLINVLEDIAQRRSSISTISPTVGNTRERIAAREPGAVYPRLIEATGRCPPEDIGEPWGYAELLAAIGDPKHERHSEFKEQISDDFDPHRYRIAR